MIIFMTVWLAYVGDRWMDARRAPLAAMESPRHRIFVNDAEAWRRVWGLVFLVDLVFSLWTLSWGAWIYGCVIGLGAVLYTWATQSRRWKGARKEILIGMLFGWVSGGFEPWNFDSIAITTMLAIGCLCALNCFWVSWSERNLDAARAEPSAFWSARSNEHSSRGAYRVAVVLTTVGVLSAAWGSLPFAGIYLIYLLGLLWLTTRSGFEGSRWKSVIADWGILAALVSATIVSL